MRFLGKGLWRTIGDLSLATLFTAVALTPPASGAIERPVDWRSLAERTSRVVIYYHAFDDLTRTPRTPEQLKSQYEVRIEINAPRLHQ